MNIFPTLLTIVHVVVCLVLILVILLQAGRGQGLSGPAFSSGNVQSLFGTQAGDFLTKATTISAICFLFTSIGLGYVESHRSKSLLRFNQKASQMDMDAIKKALERVKSEESKTGETAEKAVSDGAGAASVTAEAVKTGAEKAAAEVQAAATQAAEAVTAEASKVPEIPAKS